MKRHPGLLTESAKRWIGVIMVIVSTIYMISRVRLHGFSYSRTSWHMVLLTILWGAILAWAIKTHWQPTILRVWTIVTSVLFCDILTSYRFIWTIPTPLSHICVVCVTMLIGIYMLWSSFRGE